MRPNASASDRDGVLVLLEKRLRNSSLNRRLCLFVVLDIFSEASSSVRLNITESRDTLAVLFGILSEASSSVRLNNTESRDMLLVLLDMFVEASSSVRLNIRESRGMLLVLLSFRGPDVSGCCNEYIVYKAQ